MRILQIIYIIIYLSQCSQLIISHITYRSIHSEVHVAKERYIQTKNEERFNSLTHAIGAALAIVGAVPMIIHAEADGSCAVFSSVCYTASLFLLYTVSAVYHAAITPSFKQHLRILDHCSIFILILGTYVPYSLLIVGGAAGWLVFGANIALAIIGITIKIIDLERFERASMVLYLIMGWLAVLVVPTIVKSLPTHRLMLLLSGGVTYTVGIIFFKQERKYMHAIWHLFVLAGSILQYFSLIGT